jgi:hypothetical protein
MQNLSSWLWVGGIIASFVLGKKGLAWANLLLNRKKPEAEIHLSGAQAAKYLAEAKKTSIESDKTASDIVLSMIRALTMANASLDQELREKRSLRADKESAEDRVKELEEQLEGAQKELKRFKDKFKLD